MEDAGKVDLVRSKEDGKKEEDHGIFQLNAHANANNTER